MKKKSSVLLAVLMALLVGIAGVGALTATTSANADGTLAVGAFESSFYTLNGTSETAAENKTTLSFTTAGNYSYASVRVSNFAYTPESKIELSMTADADTPIQLTFYDESGKMLTNGIASETITANTEYTKTVNLSDHAGVQTLTTFDMYFYLDIGATAGTYKTVTVNKLAVDGVNYVPTTYVPVDPVVTPEHSFKAMTDWTAENGTLSANTLESLPDTDENYATAVREGAVDLTVTDATKNASITIPLSQEITAWPNTWTSLYIKFKATGVSQIRTHFTSIEPQTGATSEANLFSGGILPALGWNTSALPCVSEGYSLVAIAMGAYPNNYFNGFSDEWGTQVAHTSLSQIVLEVVVATGAESAKVEIAGMVFGSSTPVFINDVGEPKFEIGAWASGNGGSHSVTQEGSLDVQDGDDTITYTGLKISYTKEQASAWSYVEASVLNFDPAKYPTLRIGFYTDTALKLGVWDGTNDITNDSAGHKDYAAGYHVITVDMSEKTYKDGAFKLQLYLDSGSNAESFEGTKNIVFDCIRCLEPLSVSYKQAAPNGLYAVEATDTQVSWTYDAKNAGEYYYVAVPVVNWNEYMPFMNIKVTLSEAMKFGIFNLGDKTNVMYHEAYGAGEYTFSFDLRLCQVPFFTEGAMNEVRFYCDVTNKATDSITKTVTVHSIEFSETAPYVSSPNTNVVTIDYKTEKATFDAKYELAADKDFTNKITSGDVVTPGATLYVREANPVSAPAVFTLAARPAITADNAPTPSVGADFIRFSLAGYEFKLGADGEWATTLGSWANLTPSTEYTVYMRKVATETSFASEAYEMKVSTLASSGGDNTEPTETPKKKKCGSSLATESIIVALALLCAASVVLILRKKRA